LVQKGHEVNLACLVDEKRDLGYIDQLQEIVPNVMFERLNPRVKKVLSAVKALTQTLPITLPYFYSTDLQRKIDHFLSENKADAILCFSSSMAEYIYRSAMRETLLNTVPITMDLTDVDSYKWLQYAEKHGSLLRWVYRREGKLLAEYERKIADSFTHTILISDAEKALFLKHSPDSSIDVIGNGVDLQHFSSVRKNTETKDGQTIVFTGAMDYWPNIDAVTWFAHEVLPVLLEHNNTIQFKIVGNNPTSDIRKLAELYKNVTVTGFIDDVRVYIAEADLCVVPLRVARGIQNKVLEAMAMGKAVVATPEAAEGINLEKGKDAIIADGAEDFISAVLSLLDSPKQREELGQNARKCMEQKYSWSAKLTELERLLYA